MDMRVGCERVDCLIFCQRLCTLSFAIVVSNTRTYIYIYMYTRVVCQGGRGALPICMIVIYACFCSRSVTICCVRCLCFPTHDTNSADERGEEVAAQRWRDRAEELSQIIATNEEASK